MKFGFTGGTTLQLVWMLLLLGATIGMLTTLALGLDGHTYAGLNVPRTQMEQLVIVLSLVAMWLLVGTPFLTAHEACTDGLILRQGILFHARVPYAEVEGIAYETKCPIGLGVRWYPDTLFVITWPANLVGVKLRARRVFRLLGVIPLPPVSTIVVNVDDPDAFLSTIRARLVR